MSTINELHIQDDLGNDYEFVTGVESSYDEDSKTLNFKPSGLVKGGIELTEEHKTDELFNGKPVYEMLYTNLSVKANPSAWNNVIPRNSIEFILSANFYTKSTSGTPIVMFVQEVMISDTHIVFSTNNSTGRIVNAMLIKYTKTTD